MKRIKLLVLLTLFWMFVPGIVFGVSETAPKTEQQPRKLYFFPIIFYSTETGFASGGMCHYYPNLVSGNTDQKLDMIGTTVFATEKGQYLGAVNVSKYFAKETQWLLLNTHLLNFPGYFYGTGNNVDPGKKEKYTSLDSGLEISYLWETRKHIYLGPTVFYSNGTITEKETGGLLDTGNITGSSGTNAIGGGLHVIWDERKNDAKQGFVVSFKANDFAQGLGSNEDFTKMELDCRRYFQISGEKVLAFQGLVTATNGSVPFQFLPNIGGWGLRGIPSGIYRDYNYLAFQGEYRFPIAGFFSMTVFGGFGEVAPGLSQFNFGDLKMAGGVGFRFALDKEHRVKLRLDIAADALDNRQIYFNYGEAF